MEPSWTQSHKRSSNKHTNIWKSETASEDTITGACLPPVVNPRGITDVTINRKNPGKSKNTLITWKTWLKT